MDILTQKQYRDYNRLSRYIGIPYYYHTIDNKYTYGTTRNLNDNTPYTLYTIREDDTLDTIALKAYGSPEKYWIIADFNHIQDPYVKLTPGDVIKVPDYSTISYY